MVSSRGHSMWLPARTLSAIHTIDEESMPPLSSASTGRFERSLRRTASWNTVRKWSSYSASFLYWIELSGSKSQYLLTLQVPGRRRTNDDGGTEWIPTYGVRFAAGNCENQPAIYSSQIANLLPASTTSGSRIVLHVTSRSSYA